MTPPPADLGGVFPSVIQGLIAIQVAQKTGCSREDALTFASMSFPADEAPTGKSVFDWYESTVEAVKEAK